ncbi:MAG TPA: IPT/TIG domain-containing protein [Polyangia bacterium]
MLLAAGCATGGFPDVVDVRDVSTTFGPPSVHHIRDAGAVRLPQTGAWKGEPDGVAGPGELLVIEGDNFGRLPTVSIGGRATTVVARTGGGGIVARVPAGVPVGDVPVVVSTPKGRAQKSFPIRRLAVVAHHDLLTFLRVDKDRAEPVGKPLPLPGARMVRISGDGAAAYVVATAADGDHLVAVDLCAPGGPRLAGDKKLAHHGALLATAMDAPIAAVVGDGEITVVSTREARQPALFEPMDLPMGAKGPRAIELSPDGKLLAVLVAEGNRLVAIDVSTPPNGSVVTAVDLLPDQKLPLVRDLAFASDGETLWIVSGDNDRSLPALQPTRLTAVRILPQERSDAPPATGDKPDDAAKKNRIVSVWRTQSVPGAAAPLRIAVARGQPVASGTTIRMPPEKAAVFVTTVHDALFKLAEVALDTPAGAKAVAKLWHPPQPGVLARADINGGGGPLFTTVEILSALDLTPDAQLLVATAARVTPVPATGGLALDFGVTYAPIWGAPITPIFLPLEKLDAREVKPPFLIGDLRIQP